MIWNLPNLLSASRMPLALLFLIDNVPVRVIAVILALVTDGLDGYLARGKNLVTRFGTILDPLTDRVFVLFASVTLALEQRLTLWSLGAIFARDLFLVCFFVYMKLNGKWDDYRCRATLWGKVTTVVQLLMLLAITFNVVFPPSFFIGLIVLGIFTFAEVLYRLGDLPSV